MELNLEPVIYWVKEREHIRLKKERGGVPPWTTDPILRMYRFCNVRREDDKVTRWIDQHIRRPFDNHPALWFMLCIARVINLPEALSELIGHPTAWPHDDTFSLATLGDVLEARAQRGEKVFTSAYIITAPTTKGMKKTHFVARATLGSLWRDKFMFRRHFNSNDIKPSMQNTCNLLMKFPGWGHFMSYQVAIDLRHTRYLQNAHDIYTWAAAGPGTLRGLNRTFSRPVAFTLSQQSALEELREIRPMIEKRAAMSFELSEITGIMCEIDKYLRMKNHEGQLRQTYTPARSLIQGSFI